MDGKNYGDVEIAAPAVIILGSESHGVRSGNGFVNPGKISIPRTGSGESLNVAVAAGILMAKIADK